MAPDQQKEDGCNIFSIAIIPNGQGTLSLLNS
jgi:hypothetical protein